MTDIVDITKNLPHFVVMAMCLPCKNRWIGTVVAKTSLFRLECPACGVQDSFASFVPCEYTDEFNSGDPICPTF